MESIGWDHKKDSQVVWCEIMKTTMRISKDVLSVEEMQQHYLTPLQLATVSGNLIALRLTQTHQGLSAPFQIF